MGDPDGATQPGLQLNQEPYHSGDNQRWKLRMSGDYYTIQNEASHLYLTVVTATTLQQQPFIGSDSQLWSLIPSSLGFVLINKATERAIDLNVNDEPAFIMLPPNGKRSQTWLIR
jgi:hypothetical protein